MSNLPPGWAKAELRTIADTQLGKTLSRSAREGPHPYPYLRNKNVRWHGFDLDDLREMSFTSREKIKYELQPGDLLVCEGGEVGRCAVWQNHRRLIFFQNAIHRVQTHEGVFPSWIEFFLRLCSETGRLNEHTTGVTISHLTQTKLRRLMIPLAPTVEQERIVRCIQETFSLVESIESTLLSLLDKIAILRSSILSDVFHATRPLPHEWQWAKLGQVCKKPQYGWTTKSIRQDGLRYLRITDISGGIVDWSSVPSCVESPRDIERFLLNDGDILVSRAGASVGVSHLLRDPPRAVFASYLIRLRVRGCLIPEYLAFYLKSPTYWKAISENKIGIAIPNVSAKKLVDIPIPVPSRLEQRDVIERVQSEFSNLDAIENSVKNGIAQVVTLRRSVLAEAYAGRLVPQDSDDEPASVLIKRIAASRPVRLKQRRKASS